MAEGWIKLHRSMKDHWLCENAEYFKAWIIILLEVNHTSREVPIVNGFKTSVVSCGRSQSIKSLQGWAKSFGTAWTVQKVRTFFKLLETQQMINTEGLPNSTRLTVCNYDNYQDTQQASNTVESQKPIGSQQASNTHLTTNNNDKNKENEKNKDIIVDYLNDRARTNFRKTSSKTKKLIFTLLKENYTVQDFQSVIDSKVSDWGEDAMFRKFLRPETLFGSKFEGYLNAARKYSGKSTHERSSSFKIPESKHGNIAIA
jgi:uncharacterized phage protein (TIGR02220 family)